MTGTTGGGRRQVGYFPKDITKQKAWGNGDVMEIQKDRKSGYRASAKEVKVLCSEENIKNGCGSWWSPVQGTKEPFAPKEIILQ